MIDNDADDLWSHDVKEMKAGDPRCPFVSMGGVRCADFNNHIGRCTVDGPFSNPNYGRCATLGTRQNGEIDRCTGDAGHDSPHCSADAKPWVPISQRGPIDNKIASQPRSEPIPVYKFFPYRSATESHWRCPRMGYLTQFHETTGIYHFPRAVWLDTGSAVHIGLAQMLYSATFNHGDCLALVKAGQSLDVMIAKHAVNEALGYFRECGQEQWLPAYTYAEQEALIEALLWSFFYHTLPTFLLTYKVLYIEQEILETVETDYGTYKVVRTPMSRPDAIVIDRETNEVVVISWKTIDNVTDWRRLFFKQDLQGMTETAYSELYFQQLRADVHSRIKRLAGKPNLTAAEIAELRQHLDTWQEVPEHVSYVQTIFLVKGKRSKGKPHGEAGENGEVSDSYDPEAFTQEWRQDTFLIYPWIAGAAKGPSKVMASVSWKYRYVKPGNKSFNNLTAEFKRELVTLTDFSVEDWVRQLHAGEVFPSTLGTEEENPLTKVIVWEAPSYRDPKMLRSIIRQINYTEEKRAESAIRAWDAAKLAKDDMGAGEAYLVEVLDKEFPQQLTSCNFPWKCEFARGICFNPNASLLGIPDQYARRVPHHDPELEAWRTDGSGRYDLVKIQGV